MRLILALKIDPPEDTQALALQLLQCLEKLPINFSTVIAFSPDEEMDKAIAELNSVLVRKS